MVITKFVHVLASTGVLAYNFEHSDFCINNFLNKVILEIFNGEQYHKRTGPASTVGKASSFKSNNPSSIQQERILCALGNKNAQP